MAPEDPSWPCIFEGVLGIAEYLASFSSPGTKGRRVCQQEIQEDHVKTFF